MEASVIALDYLQVLQYGVNPESTLTALSNQRGEYNCFANNSSGSDFTTTFIDVQCKDIYVNSFFLIVCVSSA